MIRKIRKSSANQENWEVSLGKTTGYQESSPPILGKLEVRPKKKEKKKGPHLILVRKLGKFSQIRKVHLEDQENQESSLGRLGKVIRKIRKVHSEDQESSFGRLGKLGKFIWKISPQYQEYPPSYEEMPTQYQENSKLVPGGKNTFCNCACDLVMKNVEYAKKIKKTKQAGTTRVKAEACYSEQLKEAPSIYFISNFQLKVLIISNPPQKVQS